MVTSNPSILGRIGLALEPTAAPGKQLLLAQTAVAATMSLTTQPSGGQGMHISVVVQGNLTGGTVAIAGTAVGGGAINETSYNIPTAPQSNLGYSVWTTKQAFNTVSASGVTTTSLNNATITIYGVYAGKYLVPVEADIEDKLPLYSPTDKRGLGVKNVRLVQLDKSVAVAKFDSALYPSADLWFGYTFVSNNPTITTVPATPTALLAATPFASTMSLTTQPKYPGQRLVLTVTGCGTQAAGTITLTGLDQLGNAATEVIKTPANAAANQVYYSASRYSAINASAIVCSGALSGGTGSVAIGGVYAWNYLFTCDGVNLGLNAMAIEWYTGTDGVVVPYTIMQNGTIDWEKDKEMKLSAQGEAQDFLTVGNILASQSNNNGNPFATLAQPIDLPTVSWPGVFFIDSLEGGTPGTTAYNDMETFKFNIKTGQKLYHTGDGLQTASRITHDPIEADFDMTIDFQNELEYNQFLQVGKRALVAQFIGDWIGQTGANAAVYEFWQLTLPAKYESFKRDTSKDHVSAVIKGLIEYSMSLGYYYTLQIQSVLAPTYTS